jgi:threonine synthase
VAGLIEARRTGQIDPGARVVCVLTGHGLKDPTTALARASSVIPCRADLAAVEEAVLG